MKTINGIILLSPNDIPYNGINNKNSNIKIAKVIATLLNNICVDK